MLTYNGNMRSISIIDSYQHGKLWIVETPTVDVGYQPMKHTCLFVLVPWEWKDKSLELTGFPENQFNEIRLNDKWFYLITVIHPKSDVNRADLDSWLMHQRIDFLCWIM